MFFTEKEREQEDGYKEEEIRRQIKLDFAHILFIGLQIGYQEEDVCHMYYGKWAALYEQYRKQWNMQMKKMIFAEPQEEISVLDL